MRLQAVTKVLLSVVALSWLGCNDGTDQSVFPGFEPQLAVVELSKSDCDIKNVPIRDYFLDREDLGVVRTQLRDLSTACEDGLGANVIQTGFDILSLVEASRDNGTAGAPGAGAQIVVGVWGVMSAGGGIFFACHPDGPAAIADCTIPTLDANEIEMALGSEGGFGVRGPIGSDPVVSSGSPTWGIEPDATCEGSVCSWGEVLPTVYDGISTALIYGFPGTTSGSLSETPLPGAELGFDWTPAPWFADTEGIHPLAVGVCLDAQTAGNQERVAHGSVILQRARSASYCSDTLAGTESSFLEKLAMLAMPLWPRPLIASLLQEGGPGKARDFSLFHGYEIPPEGAIHFLTQPGDAFAYTSEPPTDGQYICDRNYTGATPDGCPVGSGIQVQLTTLAGSALDANETVRLSIVAMDNNGSWNFYPADPIASKLITAGSGLVYEWTDLALDKPGRYLLCATNVAEDGSILEPNTAGLIFPQVCAEPFHIKF